MNAHTHGAGCGHTPIRHSGHTDYLQNGHLEHATSIGVEEHTIPVSKDNPDTCTPNHACGGHETQHEHGSGCGHEAIPHGDHTDYFVNGHLHHPHAGHCDDHGAVGTA
jgi:hypothetical protein